MPQQRAAQPVMYGIPNCDTIKKARGWFSSRNQDYLFHNYKKQGIDKERLQDWLAQFGWNQLINKRGTTWRKLDEDTKSNMNDSTALAVMLDNTSIIKRPIVEFNGQVIIGFDESSYERTFAG